MVLRVVMVVAVAMLSMVADGSLNTLLHLRYNPRHTSLSAAGMAKVLIVQDAREKTS